MADDGPLDPFDPRFPAVGDGGRGEGSERRALVASSGPGPSQGVPLVQTLRIAVPLLALAGVAVIAAVFFTALDPGESSMVVGPADEVRAAVAQRPRRVCLRGNNPCAWLTIVDDRVVALNTSGPLPQEYGRQGVGWCPTSGYFGANTTGSRWDQQGRIVHGPARRSLDRFTTTIDESGDLVVRFSSLTAGRPDWQVDGDISPPDGPECEQVPFDRDPDLVLDR